MTRRDAIDTVKQVVVEVNKVPGMGGGVMHVEEFLVNSLIALGVLVVNDEAKPDGQ